MRWMFFPLLVALVAVSGCSWVSLRAVSQGNDGTVWLVTEDGVGDQVIRWSLYRCRVDGEVGVRLYDCHQADDRDLLRARLGLAPRHGGDGSALDTTVPTTNHPENWTAEDCDRLWRIAESSASTDRGPSLRAKAQAVCPR